MLKAINGAYLVRDDIPPELIIRVVQMDVKLHMYKWVKPLVQDLTVVDVEARGIEFAECESCGEDIIVGCIYCFHCGMLLVGLKKTQATEEATIDDTGGDTGGSSSSELTDAQYIEKIMKDNDIQPKILICQAR